MESFDITQVLNILNYVWIGLLIGVIVILALCFLRGLIRGWKYGTYRLIFLGLLIAGSLLLLNQLTAVVEFVNLSSFNIPDVDVSVGESVVTIHWTTPIRSLTDFFNDLLRAYNVKDDASAILDYASALAISTIKIFMLFVFGLIIMTIGQFLCWFFWFLIFKRFIPKEKRKIKKLRIISAFEEMLLGGAILAMLLTPFTSFVNMLSNHLKINPDEAEKNEYVGMVYAVLDSYTNSIFSKVFFSWTVFNGEDSLDTRLVKFISETQIEEVKTSIVSELTSVVDVGETIINSGLLSYMGQEGIRWSVLNSYLIPDLIEGILSTQLMKVAIPVAVTFATNIEAVQDTLGDSTVEWLASTTVDWTGELGHIATLYRSLVDANVFDCVIDEVSKTPSFDFRQIYNMFSGPDAEQTYRAFHDGINAIDSDVFNHLIAGLITQFATKEGAVKDDDPATLELFDFLPLDENGAPVYEKIADMKWMNELSIIYDTLYSFFNLDAEETKEIFDALPEKTSMGRRNAKSPMAEGESSETDPGASFISDALRQKLIDFLLDHASEVPSCLIGQVDASGEPINIDETTGISKGPMNLLDSALIYNAMPSLVPFLEATMDGTMNMGDFDLSDAQETLTTGNMRKNFKREINAVLGVVSHIASTTAGKVFLRDPAAGEGVYFDPDGKLYEISPDLATAIIEGVERIDNSCLLTGILPTIAENVLTNNVDLASFGLETLDFHCENLGYELGKILRIAIDCPNVIHDLAGADLSSGIDSILDVLEQDQDEMVRLLDHLIDSKILNPGNNENFCKMINTMLGGLSNDFEEIKPEDLPAKMTRTYGPNGEILSRGETDAIVDALVDITSSGVIDSLSSLGSSSMADAIKVLQKLNFEKTFTDIGNSVVLRKITGSAFDSFLSPIIDAASIGLGEQVTFKNIQTAEQWANEGKAMDAIVNLSVNGIDLSHFDLFNDASQLFPLLKALAKSGIFMHEGTYYFPEYMYNKLLQNLTSWDTLKFFADDPDSTPDVSTLDLRKAATTQLYQDMVTDLPDKSDWVNDDAEIDRMSKVLGDIGEMGGLDALTNFNSESFPKLEATLNDLADSHALGRVVLYNGMHMAIKNLPSGSGEDSIDFSVADVEYLKTSSVPERKNEIANLMAALDVAYDPTYGIIRGGTLDFSTMNLTGLSVEYLLRPLMSTFKESHILSELNPGVDPDELSVFGQMMGMLVRKANIYDDVINTADINGEHHFDDTGHSDATLEGVIRDMSSAEWDVEIDVICDLITQLQASSFVDGSGNVSFDSLNSPVDYFGRDAATNAAKRTELAGVLNKLNDSKLLYRAVAVRLDSVFSASSASMIGTLDGDFLTYADPFYTSNGTDYLPYQQSELDRLVDVFASLSGLASTNAENIGSIDADALTDVLVEMSKSGIFNCTAQHDATYDEDFTYFQELMLRVIAVDAMENYLYLAESPKDQANAGLYNSFKTKVAYMVKTKFASRYNAPASQLEAQAALINGQNGSIRSVLETLTSPAVSDLISGGSTLDFASVSPGVLSQTLRALASCEIYRDCVPNALYSMAGSDAFEIEGIDLKRANYFYCYWVDEFGGFRGLSDPNWNTTVDLDEIDQVASLFYTIRKMKGKIGSSFDIGSIDAVSMRNLFLDLSNSIVFHNDGRMDPYIGNGAAHSWSGDEFSFSDLTVFEQIVYLVYDKSALAERAYSEAYDRALFKAHGANGYKEKLLLNIQARRANPNGWADEIDHLTCDGVHDDVGLINVLQLSGVISGGTANLDADTLTSLSPETMTSLMRSLNLCEVVRDSLPYSLKSLFAATGTGIGLDSYTTVDVPLSIYASSYETELINVGSSDALPYVRKINIQYTSSPNLTIYADKDEDGTFSASEAIDYATINNDTANKTIEVILDDVPYQTKVVSDVPVTFTGYGYDLASYRFSQEAFATNDSTVLFNLLESLYDDVGNEYYSFSGKGDDVLSAFIEGGHSTNGILGFFRGASMYRTFITDDYKATAAESDVTASEFAFYKIISIKPDFGLWATEAVSLGDNIGENAANKYERLTRLRNIWWANDFSVDDEANWFDQNIINAAALHVYNMYTPTISTVSDKASLNLLLADQSDKIAGVGNSLLGRSNPTLCGEITAGLIKNFYNAQLAMVNHFNGTIAGSAITGESGTRINLLRSADIPSTYDSNYALLRDDGATALPATMASELRVFHDLINKIVLSTEIPDETKNTILPSLDDASLESAADLFYLGTMYDFLMNSYFKVDGTNITDLPSPNLSAAHGYINAPMTVDAYTAEVTATPADIAALGGFYHAVASVF